MAIPSAPSDLAKGGPGRAFWRKTLTEFELEEMELTLLREACRTLDEIDLLRKSLDSDKVITKGSTGQPAVNKIFDELRKHRESLVRILAVLPIAEEEERPASSDASRRASHAANARWEAERARQANRDKLRSRGFA